MCSFVVCTVIGTMNSSDSFFAEITTSPSAYMFSFYSYRCAEEGLSSSRPYYNTCRFPYTGGFFDGAFQALPIFHGLRPYAQGSTSSLSVYTVLIDDTAEFTSYYDLYSYSQPLRLLYPHASNPVFLLRLVVGYKASWQLP